MASQYETVLTKFIQYNFSVGLFQLSFSSGAPVYPASNRWVTQWYPSVHWVNQWYSSGIPVYTGPASVHWLRVRDSRDPSRVYYHRAVCKYFILIGLYKSLPRHNPHTVISISEAPYLIEAPSTWSVSCHKIIADPHNRSAARFWCELYGIHAQIHCSKATYVAQDHHGRPRHVYWLGLFKQSCVSNTPLAPMAHRMAWNKSATESALAPGASNRDITVYV